MFWLYLLGLVTALTIALRRVLRRQRPLNDELYAKQVAIDRVKSGVAWVRADGTIGSVNPALATILNVAAADLIGRPWVEVFRKKSGIAYGKPTARCCCWAWPRCRSTAVAPMAPSRGSTCFWWPSMTTRCASRAIIVWWPTARASMSWKTSFES